MSVYYAKFEKLRSKCPHSIHDSGAQWASWMHRAGLNENLTHDLLNGWIVNALRAAAAEPKGQRA